MSVHQVESYYVYVVFDEDISDRKRSAIVNLLSDFGYGDYVINNNSVTVDGVESESEGMAIDRKIICA